MVSNLESPDYIGPYKQAVHCALDSLKWLGYITEKEQFFDYLAFIQISLLFQFYFNSYRDYVPYRYGTPFLSSLTR